MVAECPCPALGPGGQLSGDSKAKPSSDASLHGGLRSRCPALLSLGPFLPDPTGYGFPTLPHSQTQSQKCSSLTCFGQDNPKASLRLLSLFLGYFYLLSLSLSLFFFFFWPVNMHIYKHRLRTRGEVEKVTW